VILEGQSLDYAALCAGMNPVAASLQRDGLGPGDVLAICAGASIEYVLAYLGALRARWPWRRWRPRPRPGT
jgi:acyl-CoA synthetase (AMP-forming)/AMP-acid ligase II